MGWTWIEEMLDAEPEFKEEAEIDDVDLNEPGLPAEATDDDPLAHPLVERLSQRAAVLWKLTEDKWDNDLDEMVGSFILIGPKVAGALSAVRPGRSFGNEFNGLAVAKLKRALSELSRALNAASQLKQKKAELPFSIDEWVTEMLEARQEILSLMNGFRRTIG